MAREFSRNRDDAVQVKIVEGRVDNDRGGTQPGVIATCTRCDHETTSYGTGDGSRKRCLALMREECEQGESNFYVDADA